MKTRYFVFSFIVFAVLALISYKASYSFFSDTAISTANVFSASTTFPTPTPAPTPGPGSVVINEIMWMGTQGRASDEWIELRNMTGGTIDLSNWTVFNLGTGVGGIITIPSGKSIAPNGFFVISSFSNNPQSTSAMTVIPDVVDAQVSLQNPGEQLILRNVSSVTIDTANGTGGWFVGQDGTGQNPEKAMERNSTPGDGTVASNWHTATVQVNIDVGGREIASPGAANSAP